ncbi:glycosyltransferase [Marinitoga piezophila KA3]|uniref:Glycosyltransferase n=1 Tax=Marinitoga piezophila (strain DSM 14283 / JCM 11233 / KA3) TaxID=443254 RepID=H2J8A1_MARPK|nr:glycosyltransferase family 4 protein [Marinitoga piezophila]AEX85585.1 glycosyltransferase [Marinitoga piezophila KA3]
MKIVHVSTSDVEGGAAKAAYRLHKALLERGIESKMLVMSKKTDELYIDVAKNNYMEKYFFSNIRKLNEKVIWNKFKNRENPILFSSGKFGIDITKHPYILDANVIHLHWINANYISVKTLKKLKMLNKKIVWTFHDMWPFTGGCHYSSSCRKYEEKCGNCPILKTNNENDITRKIWNEKNKILKDLDITVITCSNWLGECAKKSSLFKEKNIYVVPNVLDNKIFKPIDKSFAREVLNLDKNRKYISFGAMNSTSDPRKGWKYLKEAITLLNEKNPKIKEKLELLVFGTSHSKDIEELPFKIKFMGKVYDEYTLSLLYNASDVFVAPSLEDNLPNTVLESLHCGTPVVAFNIGGMSDMIIHKQNGYLAKYKDSVDLAKGIDWCLKNLNSVYIRNNFNKEQVLNKLLHIYKMG